MRWPFHMLGFPCIGLWRDATRSLGGGSGRERTRYALQVGAVGWAGEAGSHFILGLLLKVRKWGGGDNVLRESLGLLGNV